MTNREKYKVELDEYLSNHLAVVNGNPCKCKNISCKQCDFNKQLVGCTIQFRRWLDEEYTERK